MGIHLGFDAPSSLVVALGLRHAVLPKKYISEYELNGEKYKIYCEWGSKGIVIYIAPVGTESLR